MLGLQFGVSTFAAVITVAAFMLGLAGGSALMAARAVQRLKPLRLLALLEAGIAVFALLLPWGVELTTPLIDKGAAFLSPPQWHALMALAALLLLALPAAAMGAGFPLLLEAWRRFGRNVGMAYGSNTLGAAAGALLPLLLLPVMGWSNAIRVVAVLGLGVAAGLFMLERQGPGVYDGRAPGALDVPGQRGPEPESPAGVAAPSALPLLNYGIIGAASLLLEMAWMRLFSLVMLRTEYVLALILAVMLLGMGLGSLLASRRLGWRIMQALPWSASLSAIAGLWLLPSVSGWIERSNFNSLAAAMFVEGLALAALTLPVTLSLGAWLPALSSRFHLSGSWLYACNCLGAALGALLYVVLIPHIGSAGALALAAMLLLLPGLILGRSRRAWFGVPLVLVAAGSVAALPQAKDLLPQAMAGSRDLYRYEDAIAITEVVEQNDGQRVLLTDLRRRDASTEPTAVFVQTNQARLPLLLHGKPRTVLFIGIGTGISLAGSLPFPGLRRSAVELSAGSIEAAGRWFTASNQGVMQQTLVTQDDARHFLSAAPEAYDVIIGDLFHPDLAGVSSMLSVEQFQRVRARLAADGLFVQWLALNQFDQDTLAIVLRSFREVFPESQLFLDGMHLALVGPKDHWQGALALTDNINGLTAEQHTQISAPENETIWLGRYWGPIEFSTGATQHEWAPVIEFLLPRLHYGAGADVAPLLQSLLAQRPTIERAIDLLHVSAPQQENFRRAYIGTELRVRGELAILRGSDLEADRLLGLAYEADPQDRWVDYAVSDRLLANIDAAGEHGLSREQLLQKILIINPWSVDAWRALWALQIANGDAAAASSRARILELSPLDRAAGTAVN
ncbi:MAG: fused MFS/spermidine synthase [Steroidobacteraceae bacterium]|jgi:spermidine synthase